jgi:L,D-transpeptidase ErfK/SrfK
MKGDCLKYKRDQSPEISRFLLYIMIFLFSLILSIGCETSPENNQPVIIDDVAEAAVPVRNTIHTVKQNVTMGAYFDYIDSLVSAYKSSTTTLLDEYVLVHANSWIIDSLAAQDYYTMKERGIMVKDPDEVVVFRKGDQLLIPDSSMTDNLIVLLRSVHLDINIPEYTLRIKLHDSTAYSFPVRVGRNQRKYLAMAGKVVDLKTRTGTGTIVRVNKKPLYINPSNNRKYTVTRRDDGQVTGLPLVPWIEPELDGQRYGQLIHPTTNPVTLGKAYSNGCIGVSESAMWYIYYYSRVGTEVVVRYDLNAVDESGDTLSLQDIYPSFKKLWTSSESIASIISLMDFNPMIYCECAETLQ